MFSRNLFTDLKPNKTSSSEATHGVVSKHEPQKGCRICFCYRTRVRIYDITRIYIYMTSHTTCHRSHFVI